MKEKMKNISVVALIFLICDFASANTQFDNFLGCYSFVTKKCWSGTISLKCPAQTLLLYKEQLDEEGSPIKKDLYVPWKVEEGPTLNQHFGEYYLEEDNGTVEYTQFDSLNEKHARYRLFRKRPDLTLIVRQIEIEQMADQYRYYEKYGSVEMEAVLTASKMETCTKQP